MPFQTDHPAPRSRGVLNQLPPSPIQSCPVKAFPKAFGGELAARCCLKRCAQQCPHPEPELSPRQAAWRGSVGSSRPPSRPPEADSQGPAQVGLPPPHPGSGLLTCAGVPGLEESPDDGAAFVTGLLHTLALLLVEAMLQDHADVGLILTRVLQNDRSQGLSAAAPPGTSHCQPSAPLTLWQSQDSKAFWIVCFVSFAVPSMIPPS